MAEGEFPPNMEIVTAESVPQGHGLPPRRRKGSHDFAHLIVDTLPIADFLSLLTGGYLSSLIYVHFALQPMTSASVWSNHQVEILILAVLAPFVLYDAKLRNAASGLKLGSLLWNTTLRYTRFAGLALALAFAGRSIDLLPRGLVMICLGLGLVMTWLSRIMLVAQLRYLENRGFLTETIAILGAGAVADRLIDQLLLLRPKSIEIVGVFDDRNSDPARNARNKHQPVGTVNDLINLGKMRRLDWVLIAMPGTAETRLLSIVHSLKSLSVSVGLCPEHIGLKLPYRMINYVGDGLPVTVLADRPIKQWNAVAKAAEDLILGSLIILPLLPIMGLIALAIRFDSPGPILFRQRRHTSDNREFHVFKFRTMQWNPNSGVAALKQTAINDDRITPLGRFLRKSSLDELPQLFNVMRGEMSLVGPRPHAVNMRTEEQLGHEITTTYPHRHRVKPGMTGWAQVNGARGATETAEDLRRRIEMDLYYVEHWSLLFDLKILLMTFWVVLRGTNAY